MVGHDRPGVAVTEAVAHRVGPEQLRERDGDRAQLVDGEVRDGDLQALRQHDADAIPAPDAQGGQAVGETARQFRQLTEGVLADVLAGRV